MDIICLDTHILIWGIKEEATQGQENMVTKAKAFINSLNPKEVKILIPSIVVAEILMGIPKELHSMVINLLQKGFIIPPFDIRASGQFARIWQDRKEKNIIDDLLKNHNAKREELKADCMIVATAVTQKASVLYTYDSKLKKFAKGQIKVSEIPQIVEQQTIFDKII